MKTNNFLLETAQQGFHITVGAATSFLETVQNPQKRSEAISQIQFELNQKAQEWSEKGVATEQEAKAYINNLINQNTGARNPSSDVYTSNTSTSNDANSGLQQLKAEIIALRLELEKMRQSKGNN
ncbi:MAG: hypothetical protein QNJ60_04415 [Xenococcaceae cyanobacterium MO_188.B19]|nr:hypothetical protein [Xenococcaceae cyanobacterium MO_188.B19]